MNPHALRVLEFPLVLEEVAKRALSPLGRERVLELAPGTHLATIQAELLRVEELSLFLDSNTAWGAPEIPDAREGLKRLAPAGSMLDPEELYRLGRLLAGARTLDEGLVKWRGEIPSLAFLREQLHVDRATEKTIGKVVDPEGKILDTASKELGRIRNGLRRANSRIVQALEKYLKTLPDRVRVADASVTVRGGRYVIPVRREGKGDVGGVVMDESATGATLFIEPPVAQQLMNELKELEREESREISRILREQTDALRPALPLLEASQEALIRFDALYARARAAGAWRGRAPTLLPPGSTELVVVEGRHPLLLARGETRVVPFHLTLPEGDRVMVVSGPNTGGKSVFLKALGLVATLAQAGVIPPVARGTRLPLFREVYADIGDEQSISESLSTFSAHLENLKEIVREADQESLVLIDEMGTGTDPQEGAALSRAILELLVERKALTVVTSHLGALKRLDGPGTRVVNASLQFDPEKIEPTYQLQLGRPGRSYGLAIARRLGFPAQLLDRAEEHLPRDEARMEDLLAKLERKEQEAAALVASLEREKARTETLREELRTREEGLRSRERSAEDRAREEARRLLLDARREVEEAIREVRSAAVEGDGDGEALEEATRAARRRVETAATRQKELQQGEKGPPPGMDFSTGDRVRLAGSGADGKVVEVRDQRVTVETSGVRLQVPAGELIYKGPPPEQAGRSGRQGEKGASAAAGAGSAWQGPEAEPQMEVDLRGMRVAEVDVALTRAVDQAVYGGLSELRIIHGKGTGALRARVAELLSGDGRVQDFRMALPSQGGAGVTLVTFK